MYIYIYNIYMYINEKENFEIGKKPNIFVFYSNMFLLL